MYLVNAEKCQYQQCQLGSTFVPELRGYFLATENFYFTSKVHYMSIFLFFSFQPFLLTLLTHVHLYILCQLFGLKKSSSLSDFALAGEQFCNQDLYTLREKYPNRSDEDFSRYCFSSAYIVALLHDSLGVPLDDKRQAYWTCECSSVQFTLEQCLANLIFSLSGLSIPTRLETFRLNGP